MDQDAQESRAALGMVVKSGWAAAVLLVGSATSPHVRDSRRIALSDPANPDGRQPYHAGFGTARSGGPELTRLVGSVRRFGRQSVSRAIRQYRSAGYRLCGLGVIVGSVIDPEHIANAHIRIHALEGKLFRQVVEGAATLSAVKCFVWRQRDLFRLAGEALMQPEEVIHRTAAALGSGIAGPWRAEQKAAAVAAWLVLAGHATDRDVFHASGQRPDKRLQPTAPRRRARRG